MKRKKCKNCNKDIPDSNKFCDSSCSAKYNNAHREYDPSKDRRTKIIPCATCGIEMEVNIRCSKNASCQVCKNKKREDYNSSRRKKTSDCNTPGPVKKVKQCKWCGTNMTGKRKFCNDECMVNFKSNETHTNRINDITSGKYKTMCEAHIRRKVKYYLIHKNGHQCEICGTKEWLGEPILLICDHIDGDSTNNELENFRLVCSNCDAHLPTYKAKNKGNGRSYDRDHYQQNK